VRIVRLSVHNFKRVVAVDIDSDGKSMVIGGMNGSGKSSVIDAIVATLAGKRKMCSRPVHDGASKAETLMEFEGGLKVRHVINASGSSTLLVTDGDGHVLPKPASVLATLTGGMAFDISEFVAAPAATQAEMLRQLVGLDFSEFDKREEELFGQRRDAKRVLAETQARFDGAQHFQNAPNAEVSTSALAEELEKIRKNNDTVKAAEATAEKWELALTKSDEDIKELDRQLSEIKSRRAQLSTTLEASRKALESQHMLDAEPVMAQLRSADETNKQVRANAEHRRLYIKLTEQGQVVDGMEVEIAKVRDDRDAKLKAAKMPLPNLAFGDDGVIYNGVPFDQCGEAERYTIAAAMGLYMIPRDGIRVLVARNGGAMDVNTLATLRQMADTDDAQLLIEVPRIEGADVVIEDGSTKEALC
jgi:hypothetical protein